MRVVFGVLSLLIALSVVGLLVKKQLGALSSLPVKMQLPAGIDPIVTLPIVSPGATPQVQSEQLQQQIRKTVESTLQQPRPMPDDQ